MVFFLRLLFIATDLLKPVGLGWLLNHLSQRPDVYSEKIYQQWLWKGLCYAFFIFFLTLVHPYAHNFYWWFSNNLALKVQNSLIMTIFVKSFRKNITGDESSTTGELINLISVDARRCFFGIQNIAALLLTPIHLTLAVWLLYRELKYSSLVGVACLVALVPLTMFLGYKIRILQEKHMKLKDERVKMTREILNSIKVIKFYAWEQFFIDKISEVRKKEMYTFRQQMFQRAVIDIFFNASPVLVCVLSFTLYICSSNENILNAEKAFVSLTLINSIRFPLLLIPSSLLVILHFFVAIRRLDSFFTSVEIKQLADDHLNSEDFAVKVKNASFTWHGKQEIFLKSINFDVKSGSMLAIIGEVGSGKTALIRALLGEMNKVTGIVNILDNVALVSQQPWVQNGTVRENILFGKEMKEDKYHSIIKACALESDLSSFPAYDNTEIGERGVNLSGGQKLRLSLARAIYADADLYLLDDPLAAVDALVRKHLVQYVLSSEGLLGKKTRIIVTNILSCLPLMDNILLLDNGKILQIGKFCDLSPENDFLKNSSRKSDETEEITAMGNCRSSSYEGKLIENETINFGSIGLFTYLQYLRFMGWFVAAISIISFVSSRVFDMGANLKLSEWTNDIHHVLNNSKIYILPEKHRNLLTIYIVLGIISCVWVFFESVFLVIGSVRASRIFHEKLIAQIMASPMSFFETNPTGRILNRFSADIDIIDIKIFENMSDAYRATLFWISSLVVITIIKPWFLALFPIILVIFISFQRVYIRTARQLHRLESITRSPILSLFGETLNGLIHIRAYRAEQRFLKDFQSLVEENSKAAFLMWTVDEWMSFCLQNVAAFITLFCVLYDVLDESTSPGETGLMISYAISLVMSIAHSLRCISRLENDFVAVERVTEYSQLQTEAPWKNEVSKSIDACWPMNGEINFNKYSCRYRDKLDYALKNIDFCIKSGQRVGVVGRTGAGKSTLTLAMFRIIEAAGGGIDIDGRSIEELGLHDLRSKIAIIPQEPIIFSGTLRENLDPFEHFSDREVWKALETAHLKDFVGTLFERLNFQCAAGGENLSVGQRQLVCLARALLRKPKILLLDEATASVDVKTGSLIQKAIRSEFPGATVITIAHRIDTIVDNDCVMVMSEGRVIESGHPRVLMLDSSSHFYELAREDGILAVGDDVSRVGDAI